MTEYEQRTISVIVAPKGEPIFSEHGTTISIVDEAAGEYIEVSNAGRDGLGKIAIDPSEWVTIRDAIEAMFKQCRDYP